MEKILENLKGTLSKEIEAVKELSNFLNDSFVKVVESIRNRKGKIIVTGVGKSSFIGMKCVATLVSLGHTSIFLHPVEALHGDSGLIADGDVVIAFSYSGESREVVKLVSYIKKTFSVSIISVTKDKGSSLGRYSNQVIQLPSVEEGSPLGLAPMASTTISLVVADLIASGITSPDVFKKHHFAKFHPGGSLGLKLTKVGDVMLTAADVPLVRENTSIKGALIEMSDKKRGIVGVNNESNELVGVITDGDLRRFLMKTQSIENRIVKDVMTKNPKVIDEDKSLEDALRYMEEFKIANIFVADKIGKLVGIIHMHNILEDYVVSQDLE